MSGGIPDRSYLGYNCIRTALSVGLIGALLAISGCISPEVHLDKSIHVYSKGTVTITYTTKAELDTVLETVQDIKPDIKVPLIK